MALRDLMNDGSIPPSAASLASDMTPSNWSLLNPQPTTARDPSSQQDILPDVNVTSQDVMNDAHLQVSADPTAPEIILSPEQETVLRMVQRGQSVFFTGSAGMS